jgi:nitroimidazol reductase NimA-like FMN-containing flavoprotein (pyridoxamine 5'-phosphate oxidase superfamily)
VFETATELESLQELLDRSYEAAGPHVRATVEESRRVPAAQLVEMLDGMRYFTVATVTADGRPLTGPVDAFFVGGALWFGSSHESVKIKHLRARPGVSATYLDGLRLAFTVHGTAELLDPRSDERVVRALLAQYPDWEAMVGEAVYVRVRAVRAFAVRYE